ncbi:uncharacterized protein LDX57_001621 [Aspergillus melleus]|uniref:uncharacterized protein n=1 Tax=Aspergillus melleus TaxID=138277 RepID=UPI001E8CA9E5|nr:uncharacterized protein LDX57_001621 [Aspergillus melleus]KAH8423869.1 hypothetical protein LDX57_001621 [Aspergillus melleus]
MEYQASYEIVVGVDYGTTTTSVAWALSTVPEGADFDVISTYPPSKRSKQAPSRLSLPEDNLQQNQRDTKWGYEVGPD